MSRPLRRICVFCGSSFGARPAYREAAVALVAALAEREIGLVYGGASVGIMGVLADEAVARGVEVIGVIDRNLLAKEIGHDGLSMLHVTEDLAARKAMMAELSDAFVALPGGFGTLDELFEMVVWTQLHLHEKPAGLLDVDGYYDHLVDFLDHTVEERLVSPSNRALVDRDTDPGRLLDRLRAFEPGAGGKWLDG